MTRRKGKGVATAVALELMYTRNFVRYDQHFTAITRYTRVSCCIGSHIGLFNFATSHAPGRQKKQDSHPPESKTAPYSNTFKTRSFDLCFE
jgi:hypothetical protein